MNPSPAEEKGFTGDRKAPMISPLAALEKRFIQAWAGRFPAWIEGYHLTLLTLVWSLGLLGFGALARHSLHWLWGACAMLAAQWFTDSFDGALGRLRDTGIPKWGYYMDHFLDFIFMGCLVISYSFIVDSPTRLHLFFFLLLFSSLWVNAFLDFAVTGAFKITQLGVGPTELRLIFIVLNGVIIFQGAGLIERWLPWVNGAMVAVVALIVWRTQRTIWAIDMADKAARLRGEQE